MSTDETGLRELAEEQIESARNLRFHLTAFLLGLVMLGGPWVAVEYVNAGGWPQRFSDNGGPGDWDPFVPSVLVVWALFVALHVLRLYYRRPLDETEIERTLQRLQAR